MKCPYCGYVQNKHETLKGKEGHRNGDISVCLNCCEVGEFRDDKIIKMDARTLDEHTKMEIKHIREGWLRIKPIMNLMRDK